MDDSGSVLMLPYDLTLPFARYAAHKDIVSLKRYNVARVYRCAESVSFSFMFKSSLLLLTNTWGTQPTLQQESGRRPAARALRVRL